VARGFRSTTDRWGGVAASGNRHRATELSFVRRTPGRAHLVVAVLGRISRRPPKRIVGRSLQQDAFVGRRHGGSRRDRVADLRRRPLIRRPALQVGFVQDGAASIRATPSRGATTFVGVFLRGEYGGGVYRLGRFDATLGFDRAGVRAFVFRGNPLAEAPRCSVSKGVDRGNGFLARNIDSRLDGPTRRSACDCQWPIRWALYHQLLRCFGRRTAIDWSVRRAGLEKNCEDDPDVVSGLRDACLDSGCGMGGPRRQYSHRYDRDAGVHRLGDTGSASGVRGRHGFPRADGDAGRPRFDRAAGNLSARDVAVIGKSPFAPCQLRFSELLQSESHQSMGLWKKPGVDSTVPIMRNAGVRGYDRLAPWYARIERARFGHGLQTWRTRFLDSLPSCRDVLFLGDGDGRLLRAYLDLRDQEGSGAALRRVHSVDWSAEMLKLQRRRIQGHALASRVEFEQTNLLHRDWQRHEYDLIIAAFVLDCFAESELKALAARLAVALRCGGHWYVVDFVRPRGRLQRCWADPWLAVMHAFFRWQTDLKPRQLVCREAALQSAGLKRIDHQTNRTGWIRAELYQSTRRAK